MTELEVDVKDLNGPRSLQMLTSEGAIGVVAPHPDDETLGCGGLISLALANGTAVVVVVLTDGAGSHPHSIAFPPEAVSSLRSRELSEAAAALGLDPTDVVQLQLPDGDLAAVDRMKTVGRIVETFRDRDVRSVFVTGPEDTHPDHRAAFDLAQTVCEVLGASLWTYPIRAHVVDAYAADSRVMRLDIGPVLTRKEAAIVCHKSQIGDLIDDDAEGFTLTAADLDRHRRPYELFRPQSPSQAANATGQAANATGNANSACRPWERSLPPRL